MHKSCFYVVLHRSYSSLTYPFLSSPSQWALIAVSLCLNHIFRDFHSFLLCKPPASSQGWPHRSHSEVMTLQLHSKGL